jgi:hypothetical protein
MTSPSEDTIGSAKAEIVKPINPKTIIEAKSFRDYPSMNHNSLKDL